MASTIPRTFIDDLVDRVDIVEVIDHRVKLKKSGKNYSACCPFHDEKSPSFTVSPDKQFYYCFGCGATGNAIGFLMEYERISFPESIESLAKLAGLDVPREQSGDPKQREREIAQEKARKTLYDLMDDSDKYYQLQLREHSNKSQAVDYLKRRGLNGHIAKAFGIGYAPPGWDNLSSTLATTNEKQDRLLEAGMLIQHEDKDRIYDRFRERIMFPIRDTRGRVIGFGGRVLNDDKPKYLNSPETPIFSKGKELYGLYEARQAYKQLPRLLVVEGYMDVVALAQYGIRYGVATLGTACGEDHLNRAFRFTNEIVFCFDGDVAGRKAARRAMENAIPAMEDGRQVKFLYLPEGEDPDTLIRQIGTDKFTRLVESASPLENFVFEELGQDINTMTMEGRARLCKIAAPLLDQLPRGVYRELMFQQLANRTQLSIDALMTLLSELPSLDRKQTTEANHQKNSLKGHPLTTTEETRQPHNDGGTDSGTNSNNNFKSDSDQSNYDDYRAQIPIHSTEDHNNSAHYPKVKLTSDRASSNTPKKPKPELLMGELAIALLLFQPSLASHISDIETLRLSSDENITLLVELIELLQSRPDYSSGQIIGHWQGTYGPEKGLKLQQLLSKALIFHTINEFEHEQREHQFKPEEEFLGVINHILKQLQDKDCINIIQQLNSKPFETWTESEKLLYSNATNAKSNQ